MEIKTIILWVLIIAYIIPGFLFGFKKLSGNAEATGHFKRWGYPLWTMHLLGFIEIACGVLLLFAQTRMYGIIAYAIILAGALYTHIKARDPKNIRMKPVFVGMILLGIFLFTI
ncbi:DoxX family protein [Mucilaginibacter sp. L3T2-6]|uniref:DoxX family protein n=1 Tax=Mucilaginibacter sp. L3T2-6 TaxID=3062491 RepID=UPI002675D45D|nr:DoxX family protein [Mucilaginibacter sp. L3T2-6]MDO3645168.1 DoxX family protein [Mucilaginibacter sp. L3T2-6]MDV6217632.1 DoxX family protein [Mucilaginibacter sp. L3T2-6]